MPPNISVQVSWGLVEKGRGILLLFVCLYACVHRCAITLVQRSEVRGQPIVPILSSTNVDSGD